jgi:hypothetical protein
MAQLMNIQGHILQFRINRPRKISEISIPIRTSELRTTEMLIPRAKMARITGVASEQGAGVAVGVPLIITTLMACPTTLKPLTLHSITRISSHPTALVT